MHSKNSLKPFGLSPWRRCGLALVGGALALPGNAQDLDRVLPAPVPPQVAPQTETAPEEPLDLEALRRGFLGATEEETVLVPALKGIIFLNDPSAVNTVQLAPGQTSNLADVPTLDNETGRGMVELYVGLPVSEESLERLRVGLRLTLSQSGRPFSLVYLPPQDITDGYVQFVVQESVVGEIRVEGARYFSEASYLSRLDLVPGGPIDVEAVRSGMDRINSNAFRQAATRVERGSEPGATDVVIQARDVFPVRVFVGYNNTGNETTTVDRWSAGVNWGNVFGLGHQMSLQWTSDLKSEYSRAVSGQYSIDLRGNRTLSAFGAYSEITGIPSGGLEQEGTSWQVGINFDYPLRDIGPDYTHRLQFGADFKSSDNNLELNLPPFLIPISNNLTHILQARIEYRGTLRDPWGVSGWGLKVTGAPGNLSSKNRDAAFAGSRAFATSEYVYANLDVFRDTPLPGPLTDWNWFVRGEVQLADGNLLSSELFSAGGSATVRGYEESEVLGDRGVFFSQELRLPSFRPATNLFGSRMTESLRPFVFHDYARVWNVDQLEGERPFNVHSVGIGFRYQFAPYATLNVAYGWQLKESGSNRSGEDSRGHVALQVSY